MCFVLGITQTTFALKDTPLYTTMVHDSTQKLEEEKYVRSKDSRAGMMLRMTFYQRRLTRSFFEVCDFVGFFGLLLTEDIGAFGEGSGRIGQSVETSGQGGCQRSGPWVASVLRFLMRSSRSAARSFQPHSLGGLLDQGVQHDPKV